MVTNTFNLMDEGPVCDPAVLPFLGLFPKKIGFSGTREGMTDDQFRRVEAILGSLYRSGGGFELHEGDCVGADVQAAAIANAHGYWIVAHPPEKQELRAFFPARTVLPPLPYLERNRNIVDMTHVLVAAPKSRLEDQQRGGTWYTIHYARNLNRPRIIVLPDGSVTT